MKRKGLSVFLLLFGVVLAALPLGVAFAAESSASRPVNSTQLMAWLAAGVPGNRLIRLVQERGIADVPGKEPTRQLEAAGADANLVHALKNSKPSPTPNSSSSQIPAVLVQAATDARAQRFHEAEIALRQALSSDPQNAALHFALGTMLRQQERWDDAFDEITLSAQLMPVI